MNKEEAKVIDFQESLSPKRYIDDIIEVFVDYYGENYRNMITQKLKNAEFLISGRIVDYVNDYHDYINHMRYVAEFNMLTGFLKKYGIDYESVREKASIVGLSDISMLERVVYTLLNFCTIQTGDDFYAALGKVSSLPKQVQKLLSESKFAPMLKGKQRKEVISALKDEGSKAKIAETARQFLAEWGELTVEYENIGKQFDDINRLIDQNKGKIEHIEATYAEKEKQIQADAIKKFKTKRDKLLKGMSLETRSTYDPEVWEDSLFEFILAYSYAYTLDKMNKSEPDKKVKDDSEIRFSYTENLLGGSSYYFLLKSLGLPKDVVENPSMIKKLFFNKSLLMQIIHNEYHKKKSIFATDIIPTTALEKIDRMDISGSKYWYQDEIVSTNVDDQAKQQASYIAYLSTEGRLKPLITISHIDDYTLIHELNHALEDTSCMKGKNIFASRTGFDYSDFDTATTDYSSGEIKAKIVDGTVDVLNEFINVYPTNGDDDAISYEAFNEVINDYISCEIVDKMRERGIAFYSNEPVASIYSRAFPLIEPFFKKHRDLILKFRLSKNPLDFRKYVGGENFDTLSQALEDYIYNVAMEEENLFQTLSMYSGRDIKSFQDVYDIAEMLLASDCLSGDEILAINSIVNILNALDKIDERIDKRSSTRASGYIKRQLARNAARSPKKAKQQTPSPTVTSIGNEFKSVFKPSLS